MQYVIGIGGGHSFLPSILRLSLREGDNWGEKLAFRPTEMMAL